MNNDIVIIGGGGHARVIISLLIKMNAYKLIGYFDISDRGTIHNAKYLGNDDKLFELYALNKSCKAVLGIGYLKISNLREKLFYRAIGIGYQFPIIASSYSIINEEALINPGTIILDGTIINCGTNIGKCSIINTGSIVEHDCTIGDFAHIAPGVTICGGVKIGCNTLIGAGATILQNINIGNNTVVGAGSLVTKDIPDNVIAYGVPAKVIGASHSYASNKQF